MTAYQRVIGPLADIPALLTQLGVAAERVFKGLSIGPTDLTIGNQVPYADVLQVLARSAEEAACPHFGLLLGARHDHHSLGPLGQLMANMPTPGGALTSYVNWQLGYSQAGAGYLYNSGGSYVFGYGIYERQVPGGGETYDLTIMVARNMITSLTGGAVVPDEIRVAHRVPANARPYEQMLKGRIRFDQPQNCLVLSGNAMKADVVGANSEARAAALEVLKHLAGPAFATLAARARHMMRGALCMGDVSMTTLANQLGMHAKTLERHLAKENTSFEALRDEVRYVVARDLLDVTDLPVSEIALALSYATPSAFNHAFRRWSGTTPSDWRLQNIRTKTA